MIYPKDFESKIGFDVIREYLIGLCSSRLSAKMATEMHFLTVHDEVIAKLQQVVEMRSIRESDLPYPAPCSHDIVPILNEMKAHHSYVSAQKLYMLLQMLISFNDIKRFFFPEKNEDDENYSALKRVTQNLEQFPSLISLLSSVINKFGEIKDNASPELYDIRQSIRNATGSMQRAMKSVLDRAVAAGVVDRDVTPSIRDGRLVIPVTAGLKRQINGIVHDESATGKTVFVEPAEVVEAGNRLRELQLEEKREITKILINVSDQIRPYIENISESCVTIATLEFINAKASLAIELNASMPTISDSVELEWYHALHPALYLSLKKQNREVVPLNITLSHKNRILIISGPNAGGKSVCLKTVAIVQYMMQCGLLPTLYDNSRMGIFSNLLIDIGDEQSLENDLSTYSSHLRNMKVFLQNANNKSMILADEMGSGTEPNIGGALAQAILEQLGESGCYGVVTTHFHNLKTFADQTPGFINGAMLYDRAHLQPTFQLSIGNPGSSFAIDIAHKMGIPVSVINNAQKIVGEEYVNIDKYLSDITRDRKYWSNKRQNIREKENKLDNLLSKYEEVAGDLKSQRKAIISDARKEAAEILAQANAKIERTILEIRKAQAEKQKTKELRKELNVFIDANKDSDNLKEDVKIKQLRHKSKKTVSSSLPQKTESLPKQKALKIGDYVKLEGSNSTGQILSISGKKGVVAFGGLKTIVDIAKLNPAGKPAKSALSSTPTLSSSTSEESRIRQLNFKNDIDVRGMRADEAIQAVTYFLDDAIQFNAGRVRILHGTGHGILKTLIRQQLKANPAVAHFEDEDIRMGGAGITVVDLD